MKHHNNNKLCAMAIRTTGRFPYHHDIIDITVLPVNENLELDPMTLPFGMYIQPTRLENIDWQDMKEHEIADNNLDYRQYKLTKAKLSLCLEKGREDSYAADLFVKWFEELKLPPKKRIIPLVYEWSYTKPFLDDWLGQRTVEMIFDSRYRDLHACAAFMNDRAGYRCDFAYPFAKTNLRYICSQLHAQMPSENETLSDAYAIMQCYQRLCKNAL